MIAALRRHGAEALSEWRALRRGHYPTFVTGGARPRLAGDDIPVFVFHSIEPREFERQLAYLAANGYRTTDCEGFCRHLRGEARLPERTVLLTIDDGRASVWTFGYPLLRRYGYQAVVFLIPGYIRDGNGLTPNLDDVWAGRCAPGAVVDRDPELMTWAEIRAMYAGGGIDFQSHTLYHHRVPTGPRVVDFLHPGNAAPLFDIPWPAGAAADLRAAGPAAWFGAPLFESDSPMGGAPGYRPDPGLVAACVAAVARRGGERFFAAAGWRREMVKVVKGWRAQHGERGIYGESAPERIRGSLERSREDIERRLPGARVRHLCYPYTLGSELAVALSRETGYLTNFWGVLPGRRGNRPGDDPYHCPRLKSDYIVRLPGEGREPLRRVLLGKLSRRLAGRPVS